MGDASPGQLRFRYGTVETIPFRLLPVGGISFQVELQLFGCALGVTYVTNIALLGIIVRYLLEKLGESVLGFLCPWLR